MILKLERGSNYVCTSVCWSLLLSKTLFNRFLSLSFQFPCSYLSYLQITQLALSSFFLSFYYHAPFLILTTNSALTFISCALPPLFYIFSIYIFPFPCQKLSMPVPSLFDCLSSISVQEICIFKSWGKLKNRIKMEVGQMQRGNSILSRGRIFLFLRAKKKKTKWMLMRVSAFATVPAAPSPIEKGSFPTYAGPGWSCVIRAQVCGLLRNVIRKHRAESLLIERKPTQTQPTQ